MAKRENFKETLQDKLQDILQIIFPHKIGHRYNIVPFFLSFKENDVGRNKKTKSIYTWLLYL